MSLEDTAQTAPIEAAPQVPPLDGRLLAVRADGDSRIGTGHLMRCLAVAAAWVAAGGTARLCCVAIPDPLAERYAAAGVRLERRPEWPPSDLLEGAAAILVDAPVVTDDTLAALAGHGPVLVTVDDMGARQRFPGDVVLNQNAHAGPPLYAGKTGATLCLGPAWCLLRPEFRTRDTEIPPVAAHIGRILVLMGGADPSGYSATAMDAAARAAASLSPVPSVTLVVGGANPALETLRQQALSMPVPVTVLHDVRDMAGLLAGADIAVSAGGSTVCELASLGVPMILGAQNDSEVGPAAAMAGREAAIDLGRLAALTSDTLAAAIVALAGDSARREAMATAARQVVDGRGVERLLALIARIGGWARPS